MYTYFSKHSTLKMKSSTKRSKFPKGMRREREKGQWPSPIHDRVELHLYLWRITTLIFHFWHLPMFVSKLIYSFIYWNQWIIVSLQFFHFLSKQDFLVFYPTKRSLIFGHSPEISTNESVSLNGWNNFLKGKTISLYKNN